MAVSVKINNVTYTGVPSVQIPKASGGGNETFYDTSDATAQASQILSGAVAYGSAGSITGTLTTVSVSQDSGTNVLTIA